MKKKPVTLEQILNNLSDIARILNEDDASLNLWIALNDSILDLRRLKNKIEDLL